MNGPNGERRESGGARPAETVAGAIVIYGKPGCCLCDEAKPLVEELAKAYDIEVRLVDITAYPHLYNAYRYRIPVVVFDNVVLDEGRVTAATLQDALQRLRPEAAQGGAAGARAAKLSTGAVGASPPR